MSGVLRWWNTVRHLTPEQVFFRLYRPVRQRLYREPSIPEAALQYARNLPVLQLHPLPEHDAIDPEDRLFRWLNRPRPFGVPDWGPSGLGALWDYHLHQFTWLERRPPGDPTALELLESRATAATIGIGADAYPSSLRLTAASRWLLRGTDRPACILRMLYGDAHRIAALPERHLQANHLLQNAMALLHGAVLFGNQPWLHQAGALLHQEINRQFLADGAHMERSISYHAQLTGGLLKCAQLLQQAPQPGTASLQRRLVPILERGLGWMAALRFSDGSYPAFGDSSAVVYPAGSELEHAATDTGLLPSAQPLAESGYRTLRGTDWQLAANLGSAIPAYQPGHAHADALTFCLHAFGRPLVVDTGISTYERDTRRLLERGTAAHNTVVVNGADSADVWASFRMGRRASVILHEDTPGALAASHNGYRRWGVTHHRRLERHGDRSDCSGPPGWPVSHGGDLFAFPS